MSNVVWGFPNTGQSIVTEQPKKYKAILTNDGSPVAPTATIVENTIGFPVTWDYIANGIYSLTVGTYDANKMIILATVNTPSGVLSMICNYTDPNLGVIIYDGLGSVELNGSVTISIELYP
jgi:hypothetical protein